MASVEASKTKKGMSDEKTCHPDVEPSSAGGGAGVEEESGPSNAEEGGGAGNSDQGTQMETGEGGGEKVKITLMFKGEKHPMEVDLDMSVMDFRKILFEKTGVPSAMQKLMCKGPLKDGQTLREARVSENSKVMLIGSTLTEVVAANKKPNKEQLLKSDEKAAASKEPLCKQKVHAKVIDKGIPDDTMPGIRNVKEDLPPHPLSGMRNKQNSKVRLTFKLELDQVWIGTPERTEKVQMGRISSIVSEPIQGHEEYHIMGMQMGTTEASRYWFYWVPAQYVDAIKAAILQ